MHLPQPPLPMLRIVSPLSLGREDCIVHCPQVGCRWAAIARGDAEATWKLEAHYDIRHAIHHDREDIAARVDAGNIPA